MENIISFTEQGIIKGESPRPGVYKFLKVAGTIFILGVLFDILIEGFSVKIVSNHMLTILLLLYGLKVLAPGNRLIEVRNRLDVDNEYLIYEVDMINNERRKAIFPIKSITSVQFREKERVVVVEGEPRIEVQNLKSGKIKVDDFCGKKKNVDMKVGNVQKQKIVRDLEKNLGCIVDII